MGTKEGIRVRCVYCKAEKTLTWDEAKALDAWSMPMCEKDGGVMVVVSAVSHRENKK